MALVPQFTTDTVADPITMNKMADAINRLTNLGGSRVIGFGDSIMWGQVPTGQTAQNWLKLFGDYTATNITNLAIAGTTFGTSDGYGKTPEINALCFANRVASVNFNDYDYCFVNYTVNDYGYVTNMGFENNADINTFRGAIRFCLNRLASYPHLKTIMFAPTYAITSLVPNAKGYTMTDYIENLKDICVEYGVPLIDLHTGLNINDINISEKYWDAALHPTEATHAEIAKFVTESFPGVAQTQNRNIKCIIEDSQLLNGWVATGQGFETPKATKNGQLVFLNGLITGGSVVVGTEITILPPIMRSKKVIMTKANTLSGVCRIDIGLDGAIKYMGMIVGTEANMYLNLSGIEFEV